MDIIFIILCSIIFLSPYALVSKVLAGMILVALFEIISKNTNTIKLFGRIIIAACFTAAHFVLSLLHILPTIPDDYIKKYPYIYEMYSKLKENDRYEYRCV